MLKLLSFSILIFLFSNYLFAQVSYQKRKINIQKSSKVNILQISNDFSPILQNIEMPKPGTEKANLQELKKNISKIYPRRKNNISKKVSQTYSPSPILLRNFEGNKPNGIPNDNSMAISNGGILISAVNSILYVYDVEKDSLLKKFSLSSFATQAGLINDINISKFDPKLIYDPNENKFILVFLYGNSWQKSYAVICFTETDDPLQVWNCYSLSGNPLLDSTWTDYPAIAITDNEIFLTLNQLLNDESWQTGFVQTIIWQIDKSGGFNGDTIIKTNLWDEIKINNKNIRNLNPISGGSEPLGPNIYLLSNRNFDISNDTIFLVEITGLLSDSLTSIKINILKSNEKYGVPPFARQANGHEFDTNDGRILGGFLENNQIQFVSNSLDMNTGFAGVFHGIILNVDSFPEVLGKIISDTIKDFGYPNISFTGKQACDKEAIITFNHTSPVDFSGFSSIFYGNDGNYSQILTIVEGKNYIDRHSGDSGQEYERWGDYSGIQRKFNEPGKIWATGYFGNDAKENSTWIAEMMSPDSLIMEINVADSFIYSIQGLCHGYSFVQATGGNYPYSYSWDYNEYNSDSIVIGLCEGTHLVKVKDNFECELNEEFEITNKTYGTSAFPNPASDFVTINFILETGSEINIKIFLSDGKLVKAFSETAAKKGENLFSFSTEPLANGIYVIIISSGNKVISKEKVVKM